ncbi:histidine kinase [Streptomyces sp. NPDC056479]|uniref:histidine kinase n=1 Tax=Streptomyces sp. NPDC056479 TaxID=3345832 RepID=UPI0036C2D803
MVAVAVAVADGQMLRSGEGSTPSLVASWLLIAAVCGAPLFRRRYPVAVGWFTALATGDYHLLSNVQAGAALHRLKKDAAQAEEALGAIKAGSRETLRELRASRGAPPGR